MVNYVLIIVLVLSLLILTGLFVLRKMGSPVDGGKFNPFEKVKTIERATPPIKYPGESCMGSWDCEKDSFSMGGVASKRPISQHAQIAARYTKTSVGTNEHPFLLNHKGFYMDKSSQWSLSDCVSVTSKMCGGRFYLCRGRWYYISDSDFIIEMDKAQIRGKNGVEQIRKLFIYGDQLYALSSEKIYCGFGEELFDHTYLTTKYKPHSYVIPPAESRRRWVWDEVRHISGKDITASTIYDVDVGLGTNPALFPEGWKDPHPEQSIAISTNEGECFIYKNGNWRTVPLDPYRTGIVGAATVTKVSDVPNRVRLGYDDQEILFFGRRVVFMKFTQGHYQEMYSIDNIHDAVIDVGSKKDGLWTLTRDLKVQRYEMIDGVVKKIVYLSDGIALDRAGDENWIINAGKTCML